jgi:hypothetical protein
MRETTIKLTKDAITVETVNDQGIRMLKNTNLETVQNLLAAEQKFDTGLLPGDWGTQRYIRKDTQEFFVLSVPASIREVEYDFRNNDVDEERRFRIPVPASVWLLNINFNPADNSRRLNQAVAYALKNPILSERDEVFRMPFSNISSAICWGSSSAAPKITGGKSIQSMPTQFFLRPFNNDLGDNRFQSFPDGREGKDGINIFRVNHLFEWLDDHLKKDPNFTFPLDKLHRQGTLDSVIRDFFGFGRGGSPF